MEILNLQHFLQHHFSGEEIAEEFGIHRPMVEKEVIAEIGRNKKPKGKVEKNEKAKKLQSKPPHSSR
ncbi:hypothetical protein [Anaerobacillus alkaliphilus]|uniref:hypothetical protein n=1 Tax=Anaerobacillus alkaliphilus TaxID=1548597 RepID=UPI00137609E7|nr:hypothetical protein [Anaerobacillus alkaliphilus]